MTETSTVDPANLIIAKDLVGLVHSFIYSFIFWLPSRVNNAEEDKRFCTQVAHELFSVRGNVNRIAGDNRLHIVIDMHFCSAAEDVINLRGLERV